jgi:MFS family permease
MENNHKQSKYRWYVLILTALTMAFCMAAPNICMSVLFNEISADLGLSLAQVGWIWGFFPISSLLTVLAAGILVDRFGVRRMIVFACSMAGAAGAARGLANDFVSLLLTTFLFGLAAGIMPATSSKVPATLFSTRQLGLTTGILTTGMGVGFTTSSMFSATVLSPMLGGWRQVLILYGAISICFALLWFITVREKLLAEATGYSHGTMPRDSIFQVLRNKHILLISIAMIGYTGCIQGMCGYLPLYLREFKDWLPANADGTLAAFTGISALGAIPISLLSDRFGRRKLLILYIVGLGAIGMGFLSVADGALIWLLILVIGIGRDGLMALTTATAIEAKGIGVTHAGTAVGLTLTFARLGPFLSPPLGNSMATRGASLPFVVWAAFGLVALICFSLIDETGHGKR